MALRDSGWLRAARALRARRSVVLCYHGVARSTPDLDPEFLQVHPDRFRRQVELLLDAGFRFVTVAELAERLDGGEPEPGLAALSFDDGWHDNHEIVLPLLQELGVPFTVYVATGLIGKPNPWLAPAAGARMMTEHELRELAAAGVELGAHTVSHADLTLLGGEECEREIRDSRESLEAIAGQPVRTFAYPFCKYDATALSTVERLGFDAAVTCQGRGGWSRYELGRALVTGKDGVPSFVLKLADAYQPLFESLPVRVLRRTTRGARGRVRAVIARRA
jgi:peptidoglycan/xylan/chitin deacetylase (PgdA/CDA1 family)